MSTAVCHQSSNMSNPYAKYASKGQERGVVRKIESLERGKCYTITSVERRDSTFKDKDGNTIINMVVHYLDRGVKFQSYMPSNFNNPTEEDIQFFNSQVREKKPGSIIFYGTLGQSKQVDFVPHGEFPDEAKLTTVSALEEEEGKSNVSKRQRTD